MHLLTINAHICKNYFYSQNKETTYKISIGCVINIQTNFYILACSHSVEHAKKIEVLFSNKIYDASILVIEPYFDVALLSCPDELKSLCFTKYQTQIPELKQNITLKTRTINTDNIMYNGIIANSGYKLNSIFLPQIPFFEIEIDQDIIFNHPDEFEGISGSVIVSKETFLGIISNIDKTTMLISIVPFLLIERLATEYIYSNAYNGLCNIPLKTNLVTLDESKHNNGLYIEDNFRINYNNQYIEEKRVPRLDNLKNKDIIVEIDGNKILSDGTIFCRKIGTNIPLDTYILLTYFKLNRIALTIYREKKEDYKLLNIRLYARPNNTMTYIPYFNNSYYYYNGYIYTELSESLIEYYYFREKTIEGSCIEYLTSKPYRNDFTKKLVIQFDASDKTNVCLIPIVTKINKNKVNNLDTFINILNNIHEDYINIYLELEQNNKRKMTYKN